MKLHTPYHILRAVLVVAVGAAISHCAAHPKPRAFSSIDSTRSKPNPSRCTHRTPAAVVNAPAFCKSIGDDGLRSFWRYYWWAPCW